MIRRAVAQDIFKMLFLGNELEKDVIASLRNLRRMLSKANGRVIVDES